MWRAAAVLIVLVLLLLVWGWRREQGEHFYDTGPLNMQLYDSPRYYPYYMGRDALMFDSDARCAAYCMGSDPTEATGPASPGGCTVWCR